MLADYFAEVEAKKTQNDKKEPRNRDPRSEGKRRDAEKDRYDQAQIIKKLEAFQKHLIEKITKFREDATDCLDRLERKIPKPPPDPAAPPAHASSYPPPIPK